MIPLFILLLSFLVLWTTGRYYKGVNANKAGRVAFGLMFLFTAISHFTFTKGMVMSIPDPVPFKTFFVYLTGVLELLLALAFIIDRYKRIAAWLIIAFLVAVLPANIWGAINHVDIPDANYTGPGLAYLWFRIPLQIFFMVWVYHFGIGPIRLPARRRKDAHVEPLVANA